MVASEEEFVRRAKAKGWKLLRSGWPDFMLTRRDKDGKLEFIAVEVKRRHDYDPPRQNQYLMLAALTLAGVNCFVWNRRPGALKRVTHKDAEAILAKFEAEVEYVAAPRRIPAPHDSAAIKRLIKWRDLQ